MPKALFRLATIPLEAVVWAGGLAALALTDPRSEGVLDLCLFKLAGFAGCPGCGLGHSVAFLLHGEVGASFEAHPLGGFALAVLGARIVSLLGATWKAPAP